MKTALRAKALLLNGLLASLAATAVAAEPAATAAKATAVAARPAAPRVTMQELMRGIYFPAANVLFSAQDDVGKLPPADDPTISPNPLTSVYGGWLAVESAALALVDARTLLDRPGRLCSNKRPVPVRSEQWQAFSRLMTDAAVAAYRAAQSKDVDRMVDVSGTLTDACDACHKVFRDQATPGKPVDPKAVCPAG
jgi:cytochrome c556